MLIKIFGWLYTAKLPVHVVEVLTILLTWTILLLPELAIYKLPNVSKVIPHGRFNETSFVVLLLVRIIPDASKIVPDPLILILNCIILFPI